VVGKDLSVCEPAISAGTADDVALGHVDGARRRRKAG
jgi:hypothetical protein